MDNKQLQKLLALHEQQMIEHQRAEKAGELNNIRWFGDTVVSIAAWSGSLHWIELTISGLYIRFADRAEIVRLLTKGGTHIRSNRLTFTFQVNNGVFVRCKHDMTFFERVLTAEQAKEIVNFVNDFTIT